MNADMDAYCACMEEIKRRTHAVYSVLDGSNTTSFPITNHEFCYLQLRMILELISLASLAAHKDEYAAQHAKFREHWNAKRILEDVERINPAFYPMPGRQIFDTTGKVKEVVPLDEPFLTRELLLEAYDECSRHLHAANPYGSLPEVETSGESIQRWLNLIARLLSHHQVQLLDSDYQLWVVMRTTAEDRVRVWLFQRIGPAEPC